MKRKTKLFLSLSALCLSIAMLCFGVYSAVQVSYSVGGSVSYEIQDVFVDITMNVYSANVEAPIKSDAHNTNITTIENAGENITQNGFTQLTGDNYTDTQSSYTDNEAKEPGAENLTLKKENISLTFGAPSQNQGYAFYIVIDIENLADDTIKAQLTSKTSPENTIFASSQDIELSALETGRIVLGLSLDDVTVGMKESPFSYTITISRGKLPVKLITGMTFSLNEQEGTATLTDYTGTASEVTIPAGIGYIDTPETLEFPDMDTMMASLGSALSYSNSYSFATKISYTDQTKSGKEVNIPKVLFYDWYMDLFGKLQDGTIGPNDWTYIEIELLKEYTLTSEYLQGVLTKYGDKGVVIASLCLYGPACSALMDGIPYEGYYEISVKGLEDPFVIDNAAAQDFLTNGKNGTGDFANYYNYILKVVGETEPNYSNLPNITFNITSFGKQLVEGNTYEVTSIRSTAFYNCDSLTEVNFGDSSQLTSIGDSAFYDCDSLTTVNFGDNSQLTSIGSYAFSNCSELTTITIPEGVKSIGGYAFQYCRKLTPVNFGDDSKLTSIGWYAFSYCSELTTITIPEGVKSIGGYAFYICSNLTTVDFGDSSQLTSIGNCAFAVTPWLTKLQEDESCYGIATASDGKTKFVIDVPTSITDEQLGKLDLSNVKVIADSAFNGCSNLTTITIPASVTSIGDDAFWRCSALQEVYINGRDVVNMLDGTGGNDAGGLLGRITSGEKVCIKVGLEITTDFMETEFTLQQETETVGDITYNVYVRKQ